MCLWVAVRRAVTVEGIDCLCCSVLVGSPGEGNVSHSWHVLAKLGRSWVVEEGSTS